MVRRTRLAGRNVLVRTDSAFYSHSLVTSVRKTGADVSITVRMDPAVKRAIAAIDEAAWTTIQYTDAVFDEHSGTWVSRAEVAEIPFTAFVSKKKADRVPGRLVVRRIPDLDPRKSEGLPTLFDTWRFHAFFTTTDPEKTNTVTADQPRFGTDSVEVGHRSGQIQRHPAGAHVDACPAFLRASRHLRGRASHPR